MSVDQVLIEFRSDLAKFREELSVVKNEIKDIGKEAVKAGKEAGEAGKEAVKAGKEAVKAGKEAGEAGKEAVKAGKEAVKAGKEAGKEAVKAGKDAEREFGALTNSIKTLGTYIAGAFAVERIISFTVEAVNLAKQAEGIERAFGKLNKKGLLDELRTAVQGTVSDVKLMQAAVKANNFKLPLDQLATLFKFAAQRARDTGEEVDYLVESIVLGISRKSIPILDNLGLSAAEVQTEFAKTGDMATAVGNIISKSMGDSGVSVLTTADKIDRMTASIENAKTSYGKFAVAMADTIFDIDEFSRFFENIPKILNDETIPSWKKFMAFVHEDTEIATALSAERNKSLKEYNKYLSESKIYTEKHRDVVLSSIEKQKKHISELTARLTLEGKETEHLSKMWDELDNIFEKISKKPLDKPIKKVVESTEEELKATKDVEEARRKLNEQLEKTRKEQAEFVKKLKTDEFDSDKYEQQLFEKDMARIDEETVKQKAANEAMGLSNDDYTEKVLGNIDATVEANEAANAKKLEDEKKHAQDIMSVKIALLKAVEDINRAFVERAFKEMQDQRDEDLNNELSALDKKREAEINAKGRTESEIAKINAKYDAQAKKIKQDKWRKDKNAAILMTNINTAGAVMKAYFREGAYGAIAAAIAGAAQLAIIASQPEPEFHHGEIDIRPKKRLKNGEFKATLIEGESVIRPESTKKYKEELEAINDDYFDELMIKKYVLPALEEQQKKYKSGLAENMVNSLRMQSFSDGNIVEMLKRVNITSKENAKLIASSMRNIKPDYRQP